MNYDYMTNRVLQNLYIYIYAACVCQCVRALIPGTVTLSGSKELDDGGGDESSAAALGAVMSAEAVLGFVVTVSKPAVVSEVSYEYNYTAVLRFVYESGPLYVELVGKKSDPCDEAEGDSLAGKAHSTTRDCMSIL